MRVVYHIVRVYIYLSNIMKRLVGKIETSLLWLLSAGPVGNLNTGAVPPVGAESRFALFFYFLQSVFALPALIVYFHPVVITLTLIGMRIYDYICGVQPGPHTPSDLVYFALIVVACDF